MDARWVEIEFDCLPLRTVTRLDVPVDASPRYEQFVLRVKQAIAKHGTLNSYYLYQAHCTYHLTNDPARGQIRFAVEGVVLTDTSDQHAKQSDLIVRLEQETCAWLTEPIVEFFAESVRQAVLVEFDRYIRAGDLRKTEERIRQIQQQSDNAGGFVGMYL